MFALAIGQRQLNYGLWFAFRRFCEIDTCQPPSRQPNTLRLVTRVLGLPHQEIRQPHRPQHAETKLRSHLRVGSNPAGIIISGPRDKSRIEKC
jgi:hypothetical protein